MQRFDVVMMQSNTSRSSNGEENVRLHFPVLEHPNQRPEQAPIRVREMFYDIAADQDTTEETLTIFWDDEENEHDPENHRFHNIDNADEDDESTIARPSAGAPRQYNVLLGIIGFVLAASIVLVITTCETGHCLSRSSSGDAGNPTISSSQVPSPSMAPSSSSSPPAQAITNNDGMEDETQNYSSSNIFFRPTSIPAALASMPTLVPTSTPPTTSRPPPFLHNVTDSATAVVYNESSLPPTTLPILLTVVQNSTNVTLFYNSTNNETTASLNVTLDPTMFYPSNINTTLAPSNDSQLYSVMTMSPTVNNTTDLSS